MTLLARCDDCNDTDEFEPQPASSGSPYCEDHKHARALLVEMDSGYTAHPGPMSRTVAEHPYRVSLYASWADHDGLHVGFQTEAEARAFAASRSEPFIDVSRREGRGGRVIGIRRPAYPLSPASHPRDDFPR